MTDNEPRSQPPDRRAIDLGHALLKEKKLNKEQLRLAYRWQSTHRTTLVTALRATGILPEQALAVAISRYFNLPLLPFARYAHTPSLAEHCQLPTWLYRWARVLPIYREEQQLVVVVADPSDEAVMQLFRNISPGRLVIRVGFADEIDRAFHSIYKDALNTPATVRTPNTPAIDLNRIGNLSEIDRAVIQSANLDIPIIPLSSYPSTPQLTDEPELPPWFFKWTKTLPVYVEEDLIVLAMADPTDHSTIAKIERITGKTVIPRLGLSSDIDTVYETTYRCYFALSTADIAEHSPAQESPVHRSRGDQYHHARRLAERLGLDLLEPADYPTEAVIACDPRLPPWFFKWNETLPVRQEDDCLVVAMANPENQTVIAEIAAISGQKIVPVCGLASDIRSAYERIYNADFIASLSAQLFSSPDDPASH